MKRISQVFKILSFIILALVFVFLLVSLIPISANITPIEPRDNTNYWEISNNNLEYKIAYTKVPGLAIKESRSPIIFIHGGPGGYIHSSNISSMAKVNAAGHDIYLYDQVGSGLSDRLKRPKDYSLDRHVEDLHLIITKKINQSKVILLGQSFGAIIASHFVARYPELIDRLILTCPGDLEPLPYDQNGEFINIVEKYPVPEQLNFIDAPQYHQIVDRSVMQPRIIMSTTIAILFNRKYAPDSEMDALMNNMAAKFMSSMVCDLTNVLPQEGGGGGYARMLTGYFPEDPENIRPTLKKLDFPVLIMQGQCDQLPFAFSYEYVDLFTKSEYHFIEGTGHDIWLDNEDLWAKEIRDFVMNDSLNFDKQIKIIQ